MDNRMFCFQCEQTAGCAACTGKAGVCGKTTEVAELQDQLTGALVGLSRAVDNAPDTNEGTWRLMIEGLFTTVTNVNFNEKTIRDLIDRVHAEKARLVPNCYSCTSRCGRNDDYDMHLLWSAQEDVRSLKSLILFGVRGMAAYAHHAMVLGYADEEVNRFFGKALFAVGEDCSPRLRQKVLFRRSGLPPHRHSPVPWRDVHMPPCHAHRKGSGILDCAHPPVRSKAGACHSRRSAHSERCSYSSWAPAVPFPHVPGQSNPG